jgi:glycosyltransferase involved in cell wall biosynthesis
MQRLVFTVTNDLSYDQRMMRICSSLATNGYEVLLVGRRRRSSIDLEKRVYEQKRLWCYFEKGKWFYIEYNIRLFFFLLFCRFNLICAIDLDTILPCLWASRIKNKKRVYDAHELFCEMKEVVIRPRIYRIWKRIEQYAVPKFKHGYTVSHSIAEEFRKMYGVNYEVIRNIPMLTDNNELSSTNREPYILYQGAVNEGRSFETLIPAMQFVDCKLIVCGEGNFYEQARQLIKQYALENKIELRGYVQPEKLREYTANALMGITIFENKGLSNYYSLANRFFDYIHAGVPQICVNYPEYKLINHQYEVSCLIDDLSPESIAAAINKILGDEAYRQRMIAYCKEARKVFNWQNEAEGLNNFYQNLLPS